MSEPRTRQGRALVAEYAKRGSDSAKYTVAVVHAIEAETRAALLEELRAKVEARPPTLYTYHHQSCGVITYKGPVAKCDCDLLATVLALLTPEDGT